MTFIEDFNLLLKARYSIIYISTNEEDRLEYTIRNCIKLGKNRAVYTWDFIDGFLNNPNKKEIGKRNPLQALEFIEKLTGQTRPDQKVNMLYLKFCKNMLLISNSIFVMFT